MKKKLILLFFMGSVYSITGLIIQCFLLSIAFGSDLHAQRTQSVKEVIISFDYKQTRLNEVFADIEMKTNFKFVYDKKDSYLNDRLDYSQDNASVEDLLLKISRQSGLLFRQVNLNISVQKAKKIEEIEQIEVIIQSRTITGKVVSMDEEEGLPGVNVVEKGTNNGTVTDVLGNYSLDVSEGATLVFSSVGYTTEEVDIGNRLVIDMTMVPDIQQLQELVVVGYGIRKKSDLIGAVSTIDGESVDELPITTFEQALPGKVAGVQFRQTGRPGGGPEILIRGISSIGANNAPLYVIDGFPVGNVDDQKDNFNLNWLSPNDIESISVLKDASAKAIYGSRASSGVIIITTKKGKKGVPKISFSSSVGVQEIPEYEKPSVLNATQLARFQRERIEDQIRIVEGREPVEEDIPEEYRNPEQYGEGTYWYDEVTRNGLMHQYNLNVAGGTDVVKYNISGGYFNQEGVVINTNFQRFTFRSKVDVDITEKLRYGFNLAPSYVINNAGQSDPNESSGFASFGAVLSSFWADPSASVYRADGSLSNNTQGALTPFFTASPVAKMLWQEDDRRTTSVLFGNYLEWDFLKNFTARSFFSLNLNDRRANSFTPSILPGNALPPDPEGSGLATAQLIEETRRNWINENTISYANTFNEKHNLDALVGFTIEKREFENTIINARNIVEESFTIPMNSNVSQDNVNNFTGGGGFSENSLVSLLARVNYIYDDRYFLTATIRRDGSSRFGRDQRFGNFPSLATAWRISNESFYPEGIRSVLSELKIEAGWGISGNNAIGNYAALGNVGQINYVFGGTDAPGSVVNGVPNSFLTWEETEQWDLGIDMGFFTNRVNLSIDLYSILSRDFLTSAPVPRSTGFGSIISNAGSIRNQGIEIELGTSGLVTQGDFSYDFSLNFTRNVNEVVDLLNEELTAGAAGNGTTFSITKEGEPVGMFRGLKLTGLFTEEQINNADVPKYNGAIVGAPNYVDGDGDGRLEELEDYLVIGNPHPDFIYGMNHNLRYKNFDLNILINGAVGHDIFDLSKQNIYNLDGVFNVSTDVLNRYRPGDDPTTKSFPGTTRTSGASLATARWRIPNSNSIRSADYLLVRNITLGYTLNQQNFDQNIFDNARIYLSIQNPLLFTEFDRGNPEIGRAGDNALVRNVYQGSYPNVRIYTVGLNLAF